MGNHGWHGDREVLGGVVAVVVGVLLGVEGGHTGGGQEIVLDGRGGGGCHVALDLVRVDELCDIFVQEGSHVEEIVVWEDHNALKHGSMWLCRCGETGEE